MLVTINEDHETHGIAVVQIHAGESDGAEIVFEFNGKRIAVSILNNQSFQERDKGRQIYPIENRLIHLLGQAATEDLIDEYDNIIDEVLDVILEAGKPLFTQVAPLPAPSPSSQALHELLYPKIIHFQLKTIDGKPSIYPINSNVAYAISEAQSGHDVYSDFQIDDDLPQYSTSEIHALEIFVGNGAVSRVLVNNQEMLCKARAGGLLDLGLERELISLQKIQKSLVHDSRLIRVPKLLGYIKHAKHGHIVGLLREWIPSGIRGGLLGDMHISMIPTERRKTWAVQICETVDQLHQMGVVWGDGKAGNIIIGDDDIAWLIDFGGGWTEGWVDEELAGTVEGDKQAVRNIIEFLDIER